MPKNYFGLKFDGWEDYIDKLDKIGGTNAMKKGVEAGLVASQQHVADQLKKSMNKLPAGGKYSTGRTEKSIINDHVIAWRHLTSWIDVGFDFSTSGLTSIFLMYGTPRMKPVKGLKNAIYGTKTQKEIAEIQADELEKVIEQIMEGK